MIIDSPSWSSCHEDWEGLRKDFTALETVQKEYLQKVQELQEIQETCLKGVAHQHHVMKQIRQGLKGLGKNISVEEKQRITRLETDMMKRNSQLRDIEEYLPRKNGLYLRIVLGNINLSLNKQDRFRYKDEYEMFKLIVTAIAFVVSLMNYTLLTYRFVDLAFIFLLVWYYCTLTLRESILRINGSRIKGWWRTHHFVSTVASGILLIWPDSHSYRTFRATFMLFNVYLAFVQFLQFWYQRGCLYRLKALGERHNMDLTIEGFHSWMWRGLTFLLPFLYGGYLFQLYLSVELYKISQEDTCKEWQVGVLSVLFFILFTGNIITTSMVIPEKIKEKLTLKYRVPGLWKKFGQTGSGLSSPSSPADSSSPCKGKKHS